MNARKISHPVTRGFKGMYRSEAMALHPSQRRQRFLDEHKMRLWDQAALHNNPNAADQWIEGNMNDLTPHNP